MWMRCNTNPKRKNVPDCVIRAVALTLNRSWYDIHKELSDLSREECSVTCDDNVWGKYLYMQGFRPFMLPESCPSCITIKRFCIMYPRGVYIIGTGSHAVAVIDGDYYDSWDSGDEIPSFFWRIE